ncbi:MAG: hypothetical protein R3F22_03025 [Lysobacteraceae bacterium]
MTITASRALAVSLAFALLTACGGSEPASSGPAAPAAAEQGSTEADTTVATTATSAGSAAGSADGGELAVPSKPAKLAAAEAAGREAAPKDPPRRNRQQQRQWLSGLSDVQQDSIRQIRQRTVDELVNVRREQRDQQQLFQEALGAGDRGAAIAAGKKLADLAGRAEQARVNEQIELVGLLTPEQRESMPAGMREGGLRAGRLDRAREAREPRADIN